MKHDEDCEGDKVNLHRVFYGDEGESESFWFFLISKNRALRIFMHLN